MILRYLKYSDYSFIVSAYYKRLSRIYLNCSNIQILSAFFIKFSLERKSLVKTLDDIDVWKRPSISEMLPYKNTHIIGTCDKAIICSMDNWPYIWIQILLFFALFHHPLHSTYTFKMTIYIAHYCLRRICLCSINHHKAWIRIFYHKKAHIISQRYFLNRWPHFENA